MLEKQKSIVLASKVSGVDAAVSGDLRTGIHAHVAYNEVLAYNSQWGTFRVKPYGEDIRFADCKRGDILLCSRTYLDNGNALYHIEEYLTLEALKQQFAESQKQK